MLFAMMIIMMLMQAAPFLFTVEHHKVLAERIERSNKNAGEDGKIGKAAARQGAVFRRFDNRIFGIEAGEERLIDIYKLPISMVSQVIGMYFFRLPMWRISWSWCIPIMALPAAKNSKALKKAWVMTWNIATE